MVNQIEPMQQFEGEDRAFLKTYRFLQLEDNPVGDASDRNDGPAFLIVGFLIDQLCCTKAVLREVSNSCREGYLLALGRIVPWSSGYFKLGKDEVAIGCPAWTHAGELVVHQHFEPKSSDAFDFRAGSNGIVRLLQFATGDKGQIIPLGNGAAIGGSVAAGVEKRNDLIVPSSWGLLYSATLAARTEVSSFL